MSEGLRSLPGLDLLIQIEKAMEGVRGRERRDFGIRVWSIEMLKIRNVCDFYSDCVLFKGRGEKENVLHL